ncbi:alpha/beta hydrolase [Glycomyces luteolus]|uniref:Alpha/beta hydrolase n=1 Tax=Glycomyces luteolus TaxID=2670330 RepID=A0A9X3PF89_9ACTN|nr:alpha/beta hydrolase [Glycomyces luteolus]MDA1362400.1 alpha/beta hydrolase [Glycomyces luteolus]
MNLPWGYLIGLLILALPAFRLPRMPTGPGTSFFFASIAVLELPFLASAGFSASTALAIAEGDLDSPLTIAAAVLAGACLTLTMWRSLRARPILMRAMGGLRIPHRLPWTRILLLPFGIRPRSVQRIANLSYGPHGKRNLLDLYRHRTAPAGAPVLIHFHGGYYTTGYKNSQALPLLHRLAGQGWVCISANYRLRPDAGFQDHLHDAKRVIAWVRTHGREYGIDPGRIVLSGSSAGAHLSALAALTPGHPRFQQGFETIDTSVAAVVGLGGFYGSYFGGDPDSDPMAHSHADAPPFLIVHGSHDTVVPAAGARRFAERLRGVSAQPVVYAELPGAQHGFDLFHSPRFEAVVNAVEAFATRAVASTARRSCPGRRGVGARTCAETGEGPSPPGRSLCSTAGDQAPVKASLFATSHSRKVLSRGFRSRTAARSRRPVNSSSNSA